MKMITAIFESIFIIGMVYFSIGFAHWLFLNRMKRLDFFVAAQIVACAYLLSIKPFLLGFFATMIFLPLSILVQQIINPWKGVKGFIASLMLFSILVSGIQIFFGTIPRIGQIQDYLTLAVLTIFLTIGIILLWHFFGTLLQARFDNKKRLSLLKKAAKEKKIFILVSSLAILVASFEYLWIFNISIENAFRIGLIGALIALPSKSFKELIFFAVFFSFLETFSIFFLPSGYKDVVPLVILLAIIFLKGEQDGLF